MADGSLSDQLALCRALDAFKAAERLASGLRVMPAYKAADARHHELTHFALRCGYRPAPGTTVIEFAEKRARLIRNTFPNNVEAAGK
jgi:hypothetical protein